MKKILLALVALFATVAVEAKIIKITMANDDPKIYTSSQLSAIDFNDDGTISVYDYKGALLATLDPNFDELTIGDEEEVYEYTHQELTTDFGGMISMMTDTGSGMASLLDQIPVYKRVVRQLMFYYPSVDPYGDPITLSGCITIPLDIWSGREKSEGILLFSHVTLADNASRPSSGDMLLETFIMSNPVNPNYIMVEPDLYGFGATERFPQAFIQGDANGRATVDCLLAAKRILEKKGIDYGKLTFNAGYSGGGFEALSAQKARDMYYADQLSFDKTFAGGSPADIAQSYNTIIENGKIGISVVLPMIMIATNETQQLGLPYNELFKEPFASQVDELFLSKKHSAWDLENVFWKEENNEYVQKEFNEYVQDAYLDLSTPQSQALQSVLEPLAIINGWTPDPSQNIYLMHLQDDDTVPYENSASVAAFLMGNGFTPSTISGQTNLETCLTLNTMGMSNNHLLGVFPYVIKLVSEMVAWPLMYTNGQLNPDYLDLLNIDFTNPVVIVNVLEALGIDVRSMVYQIIAGLEASGQEVTVENVMVVLNQQLTEKGIDLVNLASILQTVDIDLNNALASVVEYLIEEYNTNDDQLRAPALRAAKVQTPIEQYEQQMSDWLTPAINALKK